MDIDKEYAHLFPSRILVEAGKRYVWCGCGKSTTQPLCDRTDCGDDCVVFEAQLTEEVSFCNCKKTRNPPWCDGSHGRALIEALQNKKQ